MQNTLVTYCELQVVFMDVSSLDDLEEKIGYKFLNRLLLEEAITHPSTRAVKSGKSFSYERLEFLGDAILDFVISDIVFKKYPNSDEGILSKKSAVVVSRDVCFKVGKNLGIGRFLRLSSGEEKNGGRLLKTTIANAVEALIAAIFVDSCDVMCSYRFIESNWMEILELSGDASDVKTTLQEWSQSKMQILPKYSTLKMFGPDHDLVFVVEVSIGSKYIATGEGKSKKLAEKNAALNMLKLLNIDVRDI